MSNTHCNIFFRFRTAFTLIELLVVVAVIAVVASIVLPSFQKDDQLRVMAASQILTSDIEYAQVLNITKPHNPVVVRFDNSLKTYWLAYESDPAVPIPREDTGLPYQVIFGIDRARTARGVTYSLLDVPGNTLAFDAQGALLDFMQSPIIYLHMGTRTITLKIASTTGSITELQGEVP